MCERTYVACGGCNEPVAGNVELVGTSTSYESWSEPLDEDGDPNGDREYGDSEPGDDGESHYSCRSCGWTGHDLDHECSPEECDCSECDPDIETYDDPDQVVTLVRVQDRRVTNDPDWPVEVQRLMLDRSIHFIPMRRERAVEIGESVEFTIGMNDRNHHPYGAGEPCLTFDTDPQLADWIIEQLSIPEPDDPKVYVRPGQIELEGANHGDQ